MSLCDAGPVVQAAVLRHLAADSGLSQALGGRLHDRRPEALAFPHLTIGLSEAEDDGSTTRDGQIHQITVTIWSRYRGRGEAKALLARAAAALHRVPLDLGPDFRWVNGRVQAIGVSDESDGVTTKGHLRLRLVSESTDSLE